MNDLTIEEAGFDYSKLHTYAGYYKDKDKLLKSASGGAVSAISEEIIKRGGLVFGASYSNDFKQAEYRCIDNLEDLEYLKGSKYCETKKEIIINNQAMSLFSTLEKKIKEGHLILFVGLGCDVGGVQAYCKSKKLDTSKLYTIDILCHGPTPSIVHKEYIEKLEKKHNSQITFFSVRYKKEGWIPPYIHAEFKNGDIYDIPLYESDYGFAFSHFSSQRCYNCKFRGNNHKADMTCGDFWGLTKSMNGWNENGVSIMFVKSEKGESLIKMLDKKTYHLEKANTSFALKNNPMYFKCRTKDKYYEKFANDITNNGLHYAVKHYPINPKVKFKKTIKAILPSSIINFLRKIRLRLH